MVSLASHHSPVGDVHPIIIFCPDIILSHPKAIQQTPGLHDAPSWMEQVADFNCNSNKVTTPKSDQISIWICSELLNYLKLLLGPVESEKRIFQILFESIFGTPWE